GATGSPPTSGGVGDGARPGPVSARDGAPPQGGSVEATRAGHDPVAGVVLDYCAAVRGILNDDQGGPLHPPGLRMAEALGEVKESIQRNLAARKGGSRRSNSAGYRDASGRASTTSKSSKR